MSTKPQIGTTEMLALGIEAAHAGRFGTARRYLSAVLESAPDNVPALMWMAYITPEPEESVRWLMRVLAVDPHNERARAGMAWASKRVEAEPLHPIPTASGRPERGQLPQASLQSTELPDAFIRDQFLRTDEFQPRSARTTPTGRARYSIASLIMVVLIIGVAALFGWATWYLLTVPDEALAAWWPDPLKATMIEPAPAEAKTVIEMEPVPAMRVDPVTEIEPSTRNLTSMADTLVLENSKLAETLEVADPFTPLEESRLPALDIAPVLAEQESVDLLHLIGPAEELLDGVRLFVPVDEALLAYQPASPDEKWIEVDINQQRVTAWEGNVPVMSFVTSTGLPATPTITGQYNIYWKLESTVMIGEDYVLPEVPYTMYFYAGYALHGAYWHDNFGQPMSHGCVNLSIENSKKLFEWADPVMPPGQTQVVASAGNPGTLVVVHD